MRWEYWNMEAIEAIEKAEKRQIEDSVRWFTRDDLLQLLHQQTEKVDKLIKEKETAKLVREHPDFPNDKDMVQYKCVEYSRETHSEEVTKIRQLHWTGLLE